MTIKVLVTDGEQRAALATVRSLGRAGYEVHVCSDRSRSISGTSRYCRTSHRVADPLRDPKRFLADLKQLALEIQADVLLPISEAALLAVLPARREFNCAIPFAAATTFEQICDKQCVLEAAGRYGIAVPTQIEIAKADDAPHQMNGAFQFPVVLKPSRSVAGRETERTKTGVAIVATIAALRQALQRIAPVAYPVLLQQRIDGPGFAISVLVWDGELVAAFAHRRIREKPPSGGVSVLRESIPLDSGLLSSSLAVLRHFSWQGVAMVEFKLDAGSGVPYLMEINGRLWGSLQLAIDAGVDFPDLLIKCALGANPKPVVKYESGVRLRWEWGDVDHLLATLLRSSPALVASQSRPIKRRFRAIADFFRAFGQMNRTEILRRDDPTPFFRETVDWFRRR